VFLGKSFSIAQQWRSQEFSIGEGRRELDGRRCHRGSGGRSPQPQEAGWLEAKELGDFCNFSIKITHYTCFGQNSYFKAINSTIKVFGKQFKRSKKGKWSTSFVVFVNVTITSHLLQRGVLTPVTTPLLHTIIMELNADVIHWKNTKILKIYNVESTPPWTTNYMVTKSFFTQVAKHKGRTFTVSNCLLTLFSFSWISSMSFSWFWWLLLGMSTFYQNNENI